TPQTGNLPDFRLARNPAPCHELTLTVPFASGEPPGRFPRPWPGKTAGSCRRRVRGRLALAGRRKTIRPGEAHEGRTGFAYRRCHAVPAHAARGRTWLLLPHLRC